MKIVKSFAIAAACLFAGLAHAGPPPGWKFVSYEEGMATAKKTNKPVFILFGLEPCPFCDQLNEKALSDPKLRDLYNTEYVLIYMEIKGMNEKPEHTLPDGTVISHKDFVRKHKAFVAPAWVYYDRSGTKVFQGAGSEETTQNFFRFHKFVSGQHYKQMTFNEFLEKSGTN